MDQTKAMKLALVEAARAVEHDDVPIGAAIEWTQECRLPRLRAPLE